MIEKQIRLGDERLPDRLREDGHAGSKEVAHLVARKLREYKPKRVVVDPWHDLSQWPQDHGRGDGARGEGGADSAGGHHHAQLLRGGDAAGAEDPSHEGGFDCGVPRPAQARLPERVSEGRTSRRNGRGAGRSV